MRAGDLPPQERTVSNANVIDEGLARFMGLDAPVLAAA
jgi:hypothetical protein